VETDVWIGWTSWATTPRTALATSARTSKLVSCWLSLLQSNAKPNPSSGNTTSEVETPGAPPECATIWCRREDGISKHFSELLWHGYARDDLGASVGPIRSRT
jgi:hypothetical protein